MKPRPSVSTFAIAARSRTALQCRRHVHIQAIAPALSCQLWHDGSRRIGGGGNNYKAQPERYASTSARPTPKHSYGREPPPPAKSTKTTVPAKLPKNAPTTTLARSSTPSQVPVVKAKENLNPPPFTYAPELTVPARKSDQGLISYLWKCGRSYLTFYKTGVSHVRQTSKLAKTLRSRTPSSLTRAEWQIVQRSRKDMLRLPAFGLIFLICGEWTPLLVMYITPLIPEPCRIPTQVTKDLEKTEKTRHERQRRAGVDSIAFMARDPPKAGTSSHYEGLGVNAATVAATEPLKATLLDLVLFSARFNCHSRVWDWVSLTPPKFWLQRNVRKRVEYLRRDDELIRRDGGHVALEKREVERACIERGMDVLGKKEEELRRGLAGWFASGKM
jgi:hypothetical protein